MLTSSGQNWDKVCQRGSKKRQEGDDRSGLLSDLQSRHTNI